MKASHTRNFTGFIYINRERERIRACKYRSRVVHIVHSEHQNGEKCDHGMVVAARWNSLVTDSGLIGMVRQFEQTVRLQ